MIYKKYKLTILSDWETNTNPPVRYIVFRVSHEEKRARFVFSHRMVADVADATRWQILSEDEFEKKAIEQIQKIIDQSEALLQELTFFQWSSGTFTLIEPPKWYLAEDAIIRTKP